MRDGYGTLGPVGILMGGWHAASSVLVEILAVHRCLYLFGKHASICLASRPKSAFLFISYLQRSGYNNVVNGCFNCIVLR